MRLCDFLTSHEGLILANSNSIKLATVQLAPESETDIKPQKKGKFTKNSNGTDEY